MNAFDWEFMLESLPKMILEGVPVALLVTLASIAVGFLLGLLFAYIEVVQPRANRKYDKNSKAFLHRFLHALLRVLKRIVRILTGVIRGIPAVLLMFLIYFGLPQIAKSMGYLMDSSMLVVKYTLVIIAMGLAVAGNASEMFRSAYNTLDPSQVEAAKSFGYSKLQCFFGIILPQAVYIILPNIGNMIIQELQSTSIVYYLGVVDIMGKAKQINSGEFNAKSIELYLAAASIYWVLVFGIGKLFKLFEHLMGKNYGKGKHEVARV